MSICVSRRRLRVEFAVAALLVSLAAAAFYLVQSRRMAVGGDIAVSKVLWLAYTILYWYILPALLARDDRLQPEIRRLYSVFLVNMMLRAALELPMIYYWRNWHPHIGATHDAFSILLVAYLAIRVKPLSPVDSLLKRHGFVIAAMLAAEIKFALYFAANFHTQGADAVYYVPNDGRHSAILMFTAISVTLLTIYLGYFTREWLYAPDES